MKFELMDPKYTEKKFIIANFPLENYTETTNSWFGETFINYTGYEYFKTKIKSMN